MSVKAAETVTRVVNNNDITSFQMYSHNELSDYLYIYSPQAVDAIVAGGGKVYAHEFLNRHQKLIDGYQDGKVSKEAIVREFADCYWAKRFPDPNQLNQIANAFINMLDYSKGKLEIYAPDEFGPASGTKFIIGGIKKLKPELTPNEILGVMTGIVADPNQPEIMKEAASKSIIYLNNKYGNSLDRKIKSSDFKADLDVDLVLERVAQDEPLAKKLADKANGRKAVIAYGEVHGSLFNENPHKDLDGYVADLGLKLGKILITNDIRNLDKRVYQETSYAIIQTAENPSRSMAYRFNLDGFIGGEVQGSPKSEFLTPITAKDLPQLKQPLQQR